MTKPVDIFSKFDANNMDDASLEAFLNAYDSTSSIKSGSKENGIAGDSSAESDSAAA